MYFPSIFPGKPETRLAIGTVSRSPLTEKGRNSADFGAIALDGKWLASGSGSSDKTVRLWSAHGHSGSRLNCGGEVFAPDSSLRDFGGAAVPNGPAVAEDAATTAPLTLRLP
jgi:hypothetical protein